MAVIVALAPEHADGLFTVIVGGVITVKVLLAGALVQDGVPVVLMVTVYVPATVALKLATLPGLVTPAGTVQL